jgi:hypothetical protein
MRVQNSSTPAKSGPILAAARASPTYPIGSLDVKFGDKWYAFGETRQPIQDEEGEEDNILDYSKYEISTIWPLATAVARNFETKPEHQVPIPEYDEMLPKAKSRARKRKARARKN